MNQNAFHAKLDRHFRIVEKIILSRQDPVTGLLPASTAINAHGDYTDAWVRDNVYSILGVWGLSLSYRKHQPDHHRSFLLGQSVVKLMRGILTAMMHQADRVEAFKHTLNPTDALHAKYGTSTGLSVVGDDEWGHLQLDATSLFLLMTSQMTASGLRIIYTMDEVNFVQNLIHYISRTYCTPDYGIWERGNKINHGTTEINASSVGMAKAALEALSGFNLFGNIASQEALLHVLPSDIARSRFTLASLLPRESTSKETDAALLSIIGYPAYAVEDEKLLKRTRDKIIKKLSGNYGCKRFLLDGHQSAIEDASRLYYKPSELREFEHIESEWPLFFTYLLLDAHMRDDHEGVAHWRGKLEPLFVEHEGQKLLPELYIVPKESIEAEKENPKSQIRVPNENIPLVWAQSLFMLSDMISDGILRPSDIDPLRRRGRIGHQRTTHPMVSVLAENDKVKQQLLDLGFESETLSEVKPLKVLHASELSKVHTLLGKNDKLSLTGRPLLVTRTITTARLHLLAGEETLFLPYYFDPKGFYLSYDNKLLVEQFRGSLKFLALHWDQPGQPIMPFLVREDMLCGDDQKTVLALLHRFQTRESDSVTIKTGPLAQLLTTAAVERIDNLHGYKPKDLDFQSGTGFSCQNEITPPLDPHIIQAMQNDDDAALIIKIADSRNHRIQVYALDLLWQRRGESFEILTAYGRMTLSQIAQLRYKTAAAYRDWAVVRRIAQMTQKFDDRLEDVLLDIVIRQKRIVVGHVYSKDATFSKPLESVSIAKTIETFRGNFAAESVLTQEVILHLGHMIQTEPELFEEIPTLRIWYFIALVTNQIAQEKKISFEDGYEMLLALAPHEIYDRLRKILKRFKAPKQEVATFENISAAYLAAKSLQVDDWLEWRAHTGMLGRLNAGFYQEIWYMLKQCNGLVIGERFAKKSRVGKERTLDSTAGERSFELRVDTLLQNVQVPQYRQLIIEAIESIARLFRHNPTFCIHEELFLDDFIAHAAQIAWEKREHAEQESPHEHTVLEAFYRLTPTETDKAFAHAFGVWFPKSL